VSGKLERATSDIYRGEPIMSCEVNTQWFERAWEEYYDDLKAKGLTDDQIADYINDLFWTGDHY